MNCKLVLSNRSQFFHSRLFFSSDVAFDARDLFARVIALQGCRVRVLHALCVHDQERA